MNAIKGQINARCATRKDIKAPAMIPLLSFIKQTVDSEPGFKKMKPKSLSSALGKMNNVLKSSGKINICSKKGADQLQGKMVSEAMRFVPEFKSNLDAHCQDYMAYLNSANGKNFLSGISQRINSM